MADLFNRSDAFGGSFSGDEVSITFAARGTELIDRVAGDFDNTQATSRGGVGLLVQNLGVNYAQQISQLWELGSNRTYYVAGRTNGNANMQRVMGPTRIIQAFYNTFGDACNADANILELSLGGAACGGEALTEELAGETGYDFLLKFCVINNIGFNVAAANMMINEAIAIMFGSLNWQEDEVAA